MNHGWSHPDVVAAVRAQLGRTPMPSQELIDPLRGVLARMMAEITPGDLKYSWFAASGTEAIEAAIKIAKLYTQKSAFIVAVKAFHGKTMGSLSMMGKADYRQPMGMMYGGPVYHVPFGDADAVEKQLEICEKIGIGVAACCSSRSRAKPVQLSRRMISGRVSVRSTKKYGALLIADEVQTGLGRTGKLWGVEHWDVTPDIIAVAKSLGGGVMPVSAVTTTEEIFQPMMYPNPFMHTTTTGGGALACSAAIARSMLHCAIGYGNRLRRKVITSLPKLEELAEQYPQIYEKITGKGLLIGMHFKTPEIGYKVAAELFKRGVLVAGTLTSAQTIRIEPPLIIEYAQIDEVLNRCLLRWQR